MSQHKNKKHLRHHRKKKTWPMIMLLAGVLLLVVAAFSLFKPPSEPKVGIEVSGAPSLKVDQETVNLGDVKLGQTVQVEFKLMNVGDQPLRFSKAPYIEVLAGC